jgi:hypothetical protein
VPRQTAADIVALLGPLRTGQPPAGPYAQVSSGNYRRMSHEVLRQRHAEDAARLGIVDRQAGLRIIRRYFDASGRLLEVADNIHRSDRFNYRMQLSR